MVKIVDAIGFGPTASTIVMGIQYLPCYPFTGCQNQTSRQLPERLPVVVPETTNIEDKVARLSLIGCIVDDNLPPTRLTSRLC